MAKDQVGTDCRGLPIEVGAIVDFSQVMRVEAVVGNQVVLSARSVCILVPQNKVRVLGEKELREEMVS